MKRSFLLIFFIVCPINTMETLVPSGNPITAEETECFHWFEKQLEAKRFAYQQLTEEQTQWITFTKHKEHPLAVENAIHSLVDHFYAYAQKNKIPTDYTPSFLKTTILNMKKAMQNKEITKPTDELSARMYVFTQLLTPEEQTTMKKEVYFTERQKTLTVVEKLAHLVAEEMVKLNLISDDPAPKKEYAEQFVAKKMKDLEAAYAHPNN